MKATIRYCIEVCRQPRHLRRTVSIMLLVGTWLTLYNLGDILLSTGITPALIGKILLNYFTPFVVANWGLLSRETDDDQ